MGLVYWEERNVQNASEIRQKRVKNAQNSFGGEHLLDDTDICWPNMSTQIGQELQA